MLGSRVLLFVSSCINFLFVTHIVNNKLFVGNLSWDTNDESLRAFFEAVGQVEEAKVIVDRFNHRSKGFGFVTMVDEAAAQEAIEKLDGAELDGRPINVSVARPPKERAEA